MSAVAVETTQSSHNPLDIVEEIVTANEWPFERASDDELIVEIGGRWCDYRLYFVWQPDISAMQFSCQFDMKVQPNRRTPVNDLLAEVNTRLWLGHFDVCAEENTPMFRQTTLLRGSRGASVEQLEDLVEIALSECERFYPAFQFVIWGGKSASEAVSAAILDTAGEA
ncbi:hypothetical protein HL658_16380 [Azospirillum sp. RWY-5-1]|uniref:YbjN domain-containing protein n=1 Tax=Azospirillum oleiclasticum TaxID=2735135 RepID=A0ABX2TBA1_9PROT|nr:YbjN domain-containing protein [Azospirillum oleiclasticum]NYZ14133.1 hypothetical protein [Azospirillum oleiclasticum]NYZ21617.1 hypothetical protein [Azospirillum oleiclasticum]